MSNEFEVTCHRMEWQDSFYQAVWEKACSDAIPISGTFEITPRCNFNCRMCYVHLKPEQIPQFGRELTAKEWIRIAQEAKEAGTTWLCVTGGEPLAHPEFETIWRELTQMGFFITLQTNASLIKGKMAKLLEECPPRGVKITLYGSNDIVYEQVCRVKNGFTETDRGIQTLKKMQIPVELVSTIIRQNEEDVKRMAFYAFRNDLKWMATGGIKDSIRGAESEARKVRIIENIDRQKKQDMKILSKKYFFDVNRKPCTYCKDYRLGYWITWDGQMRFCGFMNDPQISLQKLAFSEAWKRLIDYEDKLDWPQECKDCSVSKKCFKCIGTLATECGSIHKVTKDFCQRMKKMM